jgi:hypothetical protein
MLFSGGITPRTETRELIYLIISICSLTQETDGTKKKIWAELGPLLSDSGML